MSPFVGINWGGSNFRAYLIANGSLVDSWTEPAGVAGLTRAEMAGQIAGLAVRWPDAGPIYASGMIGSNVGWEEVPYAACPAGLRQVIEGRRECDFGGTRVTIVPGLICRRQSDGCPDILRGEETEILGLVRMRGMADGLVALPGTHTKWVRLHGGQVMDFATSMSGEIYDRLTQRGLLASIVDGQATDGEIFRASVKTAFERRFGLGTAMFGVRTRVITGEFSRSDAAAALRGLLIAADIADAIDLFPDDMRDAVPLLGNAGLCALYAAALATVGIETELVDPDRAAVAGFLALHRAAVG